MGRAPEEIKKGLECCLEEHACTRCPYDDCDEGWHCVVDRNTDALVYIQQLEMLAKPNEQIRWERDIAIDQLRQLGIGFGEKVEAQVPKWISVEERLPEKQGDHLVLYSFGETNVDFFAGVMYFIRYDERPHFENDGLYGLHVTHWMPLPNLPKEG